MPGWRAHCAALLRIFAAISRSQQSLVPRTICAATLLGRLRSLCAAAVSTVLKLRCFGSCAPAIMRVGKPAVALCWAGVCMSFVCTVYCENSTRQLVVHETSSAYTRVTENALSLEVSDARTTRIELQDQGTGSQVVQASTPSAKHRRPQHHVHANYEDMFFRLGYDLDSSLATIIPHSNPAVWLYSLITTDFAGNKLIPHFIRHYTDSGIRTHMIYVDLLHDPALAEDGLMEARTYFQGAGIRTRTILHPYTPDLQDLAMVTGLAKIPMQLEDWVVVADMDEYFTYGNSSTVQEAAKIMEDQGASYAAGEMLDHVAPGGVLKQVSNATNIWTQFPLICPIISNVAKGLPVKVTLHKAYLRSGAGHHHIVEPSLAKAYFSNQCEGLQCELVMKRYKQRSTRDVYAYTPYQHYQEQYAESVNASGWQAKRWQTWTKAHHFKWHAAVLDNLHARMIRDSGNCVLGVNEDDCQPVFQFWKEVARQYSELNRSRSIDISGLHCKVGVDTLWDW